MEIVSAVNAATEKSTRVVGGMGYYSVLHTERVLNKTCSSPSRFHAVVSFFWIRNFIRRYHDSSAIRNTETVFPLTGNRTTCVAINRTRWQRYRNALLLDRLTEKRTRSRQRQKRFKQRVDYHRTAWTSSVKSYHFIRNSLRVRHIYNMYKYWWNQ